MNQQYQNLPALNRYTSATQYAALCKIKETKSIVPLVFGGGSSKTLGALVRSMWIKSETFTDENGVTREGWFVTPEGEHAMRMYEAKKAEEDRREAVEVKIAEAMREEAIRYFVARARYHYAKKESDTAFDEMSRLDSRIKYNYPMNPLRREAVLQDAHREYKQRLAEKMNEIKEQTSC